MSIPTVELDSKEHWEWHDGHCPLCDELPVYRDVDNPARFLCPECCRMYFVFVAYGFHGDRAKQIQAEYDKFKG